MDLLMPMLIGLVVGGSTAVAAVLITMLMLPKACPRCQAPFPKLRWQWKHSGWKRTRRDGKVLFVCGQCGCEMTARGVPVDPPPA